MKDTIRLAPIALLLGICGCAPYQGFVAPDGRYVPASPRPTFGTPAPAPSVVVVPPPAQVQQPAPAVAPAPRATTPSDEAFDKEYLALQEKLRDRKINTYLNEGGDALWKGTIKDTRDKFKTAISMADEMIDKLKKDLAIAGSDYSSDPRYVKIKANRDRLAQKLSDMDARILDAIATETTGEAALRLIWRDEDKAEAAAAMENLLNASQASAAETEKLLEQSNW